ncbi:MAG: single-stranded-DNA-specific exonuclease RecJ [Candidatus Zambryskibacteria bacterium RIFCSPHIGHO2_01_FULL_44_22b]|uniref:Single-stranded-DNA-specific exonuclease RecJ n=2 Tax=Candidatus Zambryskiibacteriota TaxID=1817925 RepID=A0A1G2SY85_9BACT|nr:MAG: single-stranded-DNA-specific exonuclease RecJ [Candidatus Zambryskibacteria bacterium RIFCSPHIGHO2_01_FULL_44_22b]OHB05585.1 MAG: single-stranded-DNA-specific exonuclease RecJ [Candidatus Zambryskibacteria bacterium RIFCSPLOWO2_01_FULL_45_43]
MHFPELLDILFDERGILLENRGSFLNPDYSKLHSPMLLPDMEKARDRVIQAIKDNEHIVVFSDYDCDGIPGAVVLSDFFRRIRYENVSFYIPHRHLEGFGLNFDAIDEIESRGAKLIITIDCGIADIEEVRVAQEKGIDVIITDHHQQKPELPPAYTVVNPNRTDSTYPFKGICGSATVFKLVQAVYEKESFGVKPGMEKWSLDMVGLATFSDMVPLIDENRIFAKFGLEVLKKSPRPGLAALSRKLNLDRKNMCEDDVTFMITPRINAASRMGVPKDAFDLLRTEKLEEAEGLALHLEKINNERKGLVASMVKEAKANIEKRQNMLEVIVVGSPEWRPAVVGLVANSLVEEYNRPAFVWGRDGAGHHPSSPMVLKGSCRSYNGYNLFLLMSAIGEAFIEFGGHPGAGGFSVTLENLTTLEEKLSKALKSLKAVEPQLRGSTAKWIKIADIGENLWNTISPFAPFGMGNPKPIFDIKGEIKSFRQFGKENNHLELVLTDGKKEVKAISFFSSPTAYSLLPTTKICTVRANLEKSYFRNRPELRLRIVDIISA